MQLFYKRLAASLLVLIPIQGAAIEWSSIIKKPAYEVFVDIDSYTVLEGKPVMKTKTIFKSAQTHLSDPKSIEYSHRIEATQFDCLKPQYKPLHYKLYDVKDQLLITEQLKSNFQPITSNDSDIFSIGQLTCQVHQMLGG